MIYMKKKTNMVHMGDLVHKRCVSFSPNNETKILPTVGMSQEQLDVEMPIVIYQNRYYNTVGHSELHVHAAHYDVLLSYSIEATYNE